MFLDKMSWTNNVTYFPFKVVSSGQGKLFNPDTIQNNEQSFQWLYC